MLAQREVDHQFQLENRQLTPDGVLVELDADQRLDVHVLIKLALFETLAQVRQLLVIETMQIEDVLAVIQRHVGVVPHQVLDRIDLGIARHQDTAHRRAKILVHRHVGLLADLIEDAEQVGDFFFVAAGEVPLDELDVGLGAEEAPGDQTRGVDEVLDEVVRLGHGQRVEGRRHEVVETLEAAALHQLGQTALDGDFKARVGAEGGEDTAGLRVHQRDAGHRELTAQRGVLDQNREALGFQRLDAFDDFRVLGQHLLRHVRQGQFLLENLALHGTLEDLGQTLHLGFRQSIAGAHAVAEIQVLDQVGREVDRLTVRTASERQGHDATIRTPGIGVDQIGATQLAVRIEDLQAIVIQHAFRDLVIRARLEPLLVRVMHELAVSDGFAEELVVVEEVAAQALDELAQCRAQRALLGRALAVGEAHR